MYFPLKMAVVSEALSSISPPPKDTSRATLSPKDRCLLVPFCIPLEA